MKSSMAIRASAAGAAGAGAGGGAARRRRRRPAAGACRRWSGLVHGGLLLGRTCGPSARGHIGARPHCRAALQRASRRCRQAPSSSRQRRAAGVVSPTRRRISAARRRHHRQQQHRRDAHGLGRPRTARRRAARRSAGSLASAHGALLGDEVVGGVDDLERRGHAVVQRQPVHRLAVPGERVRHDLRQRGRRSPAGDDAGRGTSRPSAPTRLTRLPRLLARSTL